MKKSLIRSASIVIIMSLLAACGGAEVKLPSIEVKVDDPVTPGTETPDTDTPDTDTPDTDTPDTDTPDTDTPDTDTPDTDTPDTDTPDTDTPDTDTPDTDTPDTDTPDTDTPDTDTPDTDTPDTDTPDTDTPDTDTPDTDTPDTDILAEIINGSFEGNTAGQISPLGNWVLRPEQEAPAVSTIQVIESEEGVNSYKGTKAVEVIVDTLGPNPWSIEVAYEDIPVEGGKTYEFNVWVKGEEGTSVDFYIQTPAPDYGQLNLTNQILTGGWQEIEMVAATSEADTLIRLAVHFSKEGNIGKSFYLDEFSGIILPDVESSDVTVTSLKALANFPIGVAVPRSLFSNAKHQDVVFKHFSQLSSENDMKMDAMHPSEDTYNWAKADEILNFADDNGLTVHGHVLVWHSQIPNWMRNFSGNTAAWVAMMESHVTTIATKYAGRLETWDVVNEAFNENGSYRGSASGDDSVWYTNIGESFIPKAFIAARAADADVDLYYNDYNLIWNDAKLGGVINMVKDMQADGVPIDGIGFQSHITVNSPNIATIKRQFQKVVDLGLKVKITELDVRMNNPSEIGAKVTAFTAARAEVQKQYYFDVVQAYLDVVPADKRGGITVWGTNDRDSWLQNFPAPTVEWPLMFNDDFTPKPALQGFADALVDGVATE